MPGGRTSCTPTLTPLPATDFFQVLCRKACHLPPSWGWGHRWAGRPQSPFSSKLLNFEGVSLFNTWHQDLANYISSLLFLSSGSCIWKCSLRYSERERGNDFCLYNSCSSRLSSVSERVGGLDRARWILGMRIPQGTGLGVHVWGFPSILLLSSQAFGLGDMSRSTLVRLRGEPGLGLGSERGPCLPLPLTPQSAFKMRLLPLGCGC